MSRILPLSLVCFAGPLLSAPVRADAPPDMAKYDCTRTDDGKSVTGDKLAAQGFEVIARARFSNVNLMMLDPKTSVRANCFLRAPSK